MSSHAHRWVTELNELVAEYDEWRHRRWRRLLISILVLAGILWLAFGVFHLKSISGPLWLVFSGGAAAQAIRAAQQKIADHLHDADDPPCVAGLAKFAVH